ncbi:MAG: Peptidase [Candidatus Amesbacteria bacterium GW2011_GWB1_47_19]|nr:MAG: Peptidase [Candidatus Amesbacteria bacterium GW2011_GWA1_44_24]KKU31918.1 MAG: Peptidase [Candidatus Amesbacteria bacterium GW2011_GWC1_46_24]KKU66854.1 MAG: Peptidase [Candidatus Amesbacteria bacterium GW2011_GWB1_47_19]OGD05618.1 MAG: hypothetical protein A2379_00305 [Candidatus Amesbacteria bacterium RIFOXYB1_FULL_47_13]HBC72193.1 hypothetical protein [Candidatus Amesbacteria bacterium]
MIKVIAAVLIGIVLGGLGMGGYFQLTEKTKLPAEQREEKQLTLLKYSIENLSQRAYGSVIVWDEASATMAANLGKPGFTARRFHFDSDGRRVNGLAHIPEGNGPFPVIIQIRGFIDQSGYLPGAGTWRSAEKFVQAGFLSLAPDFLGYGGSDNPSANIFEARFQTYTTVLNLLADISSLPMADAGKVGLWGHSNGGQIALTVLEASGRDYPTSLWAPVTARFPYSILYYTDDAEDGGKALREDLAEFESDYDSDEFAMTQHPDLIDAPIILHQGTRDTWVPVSWSRNLVKRLKDLDKKINYVEYPGADHNLLPVWQTVVDKDIQFFREEMGLTQSE